MSLPLKEIIKIGENQLAASGVQDAAIDAKELYCYLMGIDRMRLMLRWQDILQDNQCEEYFQLIEKRAARIPLQHITGVQEFMGLEFKVNENVLIPRQDTETLVEDALEVMRKGTLRGEELPMKAKKSWAVLDLCCGSGAIGVSLAANETDAKVTCADVSDAALMVARENGSAHAKSVKFVKSDMFDAFKGRLGNKKFDMIISNPPYIKKEVIETLEPEVKDHEPMMALDGGEDGLDFYRIIAQHAEDFLKKEGMLMMEIGHDQMEEVKGLIEASGKYSYVTGLKDLAGRDRIVVAVLAPKAK